MSVNLRVLGVLVSIVVLLGGPLAFLSTGIANADGPPSFEIFFIPFDVETLSPVTPDTIEDSASCRLTFPLDGDEATVLRRSLERAEEGRFEGRLVRVKVVGLEIGDLFIDRDGGIRLSRDAVQKRLCGESFTVVRALVRTLAKNHRCGE